MRFSGMFEERPLHKCELQFYPSDSHYTIKKFHCWNWVIQHVRSVSEGNFSAIWALLRCRLWLKPPKWFIVWLYLSHPTRISNLAREAARREQRGIPSLPRRLTEAQRFQKKNPHLLFARAGVFDMSWSWGGRMKWVFFSAICVLGMNITESID